MLHTRNLLAFCHDLAAAALAWIGGFMLRFNFDVGEPWWSQMWGNLAWIVPLQGVILWRLHLYQNLWRYASVPDLRRIAMAAFFGIGALTMILLIFEVRGVPRTVLITYPILLAVFMGASRFAYRMWKEGRFVSPKELDARRVVILGAGEVGTGLALTLRASRELIVVGFLDDATKLTGQRVGEWPVLGTISDLPRLRSELDIEQAIIAMPSATHQERRRAFSQAADAGIPAYAVPAFADLASGRVQISQLHRVDLDDLLGRDQVTLDTDGLRALLADRTVLVSGAGGSIGSELCRQIAAHAPARLVLVEANEFALYQIDDELRRRFVGLQITAIIADVKDAARLDAVFAMHRPVVVFHAAAYKHVPLMEEHNAWEAARNNILGTYCIARAAIAHHATSFILISTDKAVNPTNVMGATKRVAEVICQVLQRNAATRFVTVRFGNVLGSTGSVVPKFRAQIAAGGPITVTHPDVTRYFMLIPEATQLVLQAGAMGKGGEIFVLDMGEPVKIVDLAHDMIRLSGLREEDIRIEFIGLRPGEKLFEEVLADNEATLATPHPRLRVARATAELDAQWLEQAIIWLEMRGDRSDVAVRETLARWVKEYRPTTSTSAST